MIEAEVHTQLLGFLRSQNIASWPHNLTMARLVARALRLSRSALIQTSTAAEERFSPGESLKKGEYACSYLVPALLWQGAVIIVAPESVRERLLKLEIPQLQDWLKIEKEIKEGASWPCHQFQGLMLLDSHTWLHDSLTSEEPFPHSIPTIIDCADDLQEWTREVLTATIENWHWDQLMANCPQEQESIRNLRVELAKAIFSHPPNPYECCLLEDSERENLQRLCENLAVKGLLTPSWSNFWLAWQTNGQILWASRIDREIGRFNLHVAPVEVANRLKDLWQQQPVVLIGSFLDATKTASTYRQQLGLPEMLCLKFAPNPDYSQLQLYLPKSFPMPNTPQFQGRLREQIRILVGFSRNRQQPVVLLVEDLPLKEQIGAEIAAEFGSRVGVEKTNLGENGILVSGWQFWREHQNKFRMPQLLAIATLPFPSLENPLVAARVAYYKSQRQDWFRLDLLPTALREIQRAVLPLRGSSGIVALFDNRVNHRSYGSKIFSALEPYDRFNYIDPSWFV